MTAILDNRTAAGFFRMFAVVVILAVAVPILAFAGAIVLAGGLP